MNKNKTPKGGSWSFDSDNRKKLPKNIEVPNLKVDKENDKTVLEVMKFVEKEFPDHPGSTETFWLPTDRNGYLRIFNSFLKEKFESFGDYQDALSKETPFLFHSLISPGLNLGLITPDEVVAKAEKVFTENKISINSAEGFIRQVLGWREFIRGIYQEFSEKQEDTNFWKHERRMKSPWWDGTTGIPPVDYAIQKAQTYGYNHHIERLMVLSNVMLLSEIHPKEVHSWFMSMYVDSSDWVMGPNVYGMGQFSDGGIFATKPYICGSNYILKMSQNGKNEWGKGDWCDVLDGLYWRFIDKNKKFFSKNPRLNMMVKTLEKMKSDRKEKIFDRAENFIKLNTR